MKELSIEQKAKRYDEAIERVKKWHNAPNIDKMPTYGNRIIEEIFPELKESNGDGIKEELILYLKGIRFTTIERAEQVRNWIAWLEKQGEPNPYSGTSFEYNGHTWGTLEVKEVDFEEEYAKYSNDINAEYAFPIDLADYKEFAKHFFELGLKAQKGE